MMKLKEKLKFLKRVQKRATKEEFKAKMRVLLVMCDTCEYSWTKSNTIKKHVNAKHAEKYLAPYLIFLTCGKWAFRFKEDPAEDKGGRKSIFWRTKHWREIPLISIVRINHTGQIYLDL